MRPGIMFFQSVGDVGKKGHESGSLDGLGEHSLMLGAGAGDPSGSDLSGRRDVLLEKIDILVVDVIDMVLREVANLFLGFYSAVHCFSILLPPECFRRQNGRSSSDESIPS